MFEDGARDTEHAYMKLVDQAKAASLELEDRIEKDTARIDTHLGGRSPTCTIISPSSSEGQRRPGR